MSTKAPASSARPGPLGAIFGSLATFYERRWLIRYLTQRQWARNYRSSYLGMLWAFLSPLLMVVLLTLVFSEILNIRFKEVTGDSALNFGLYLYCGLLPFTTYSEALSRGVNVIRRNSEMVQRVVFPVEILPLSTVLTSLIQAAFGLGALMFVLLVVEQRLHVSVLLLPIVLVPQVLFVLGLTYLMAVAGTYLPDVREALRAVIRASFFITPVIWPVERVPDNLRLLVDLNPLAFLVGAYRDLVLDGELPGMMATVYFSLFAVAMFGFGLALFNRLKHNFADLL